jgi:5-oxoprolinase (ATP-hydrolysing) subunit C
MPSLIVVDAGVASIQGLGRYGSQRYGVAPGGAMDRLGLAEANALTGQPHGAAAIEIGPLPLKLRTSGGAVRIGLSGADRAAFIDGRPLAIGATAVAYDGQTIDIRGVRSGRFSYLSIQGGLAGRGESFREGANFPTGRASPRSWILNVGEVLDLNEMTPGQDEKRLRQHVRSNVPVRVVLGPQDDYFSKDALEQFLSTPWRISHASDRMAYRLDGLPVPLERGFNIVSDGTVTGNIQITGNGQPLAILCDRGTTGGYPKIATIISADLGRFVQTTVGGQVHFTPVSIVEAHYAARDFAFNLANVKPRVESVRTASISLEALLMSNVAGDAFDAADDLSWWHEDVCSLAQRSTP